MKVIGLIFKEQSVLVENNGVIGQISFEAVSQYQDLMINEQIQAIISLLKVNIM